MFEQVKGPTDARGGQQIKASAIEQVEIGHEPVAISDLHST